MTSLLHADFCHVLLVFGNSYFSDCFCQYCHIVAKDGEKRKIDTGVEGVQKSRHNSKRVISLAKGKKQKECATILWFSLLLFGTIRLSQHQKGKTNLDLLEQETVSGKSLLLSSRLHQSCDVCLEAQYHKDN